MIEQYYLVPVAHHSGQRHMLWKKLIYSQMLISEEYENEIGKGNYVQYLTFASVKKLAVHPLFEFSSPYHAIQSAITTHHLPLDCRLYRLYALYGVPPLVCTRLGFHWFSFLQYELYPNAIPREGSTILG